MKNWSTDTTELKKDKEKFAIWRLEQLINYGLDGEKLDRDELKGRWNSLDLDESKKKFLSLLLWQK